ncbi:hypothetical protein ANO11243_036220 [Dothideomycetidae sp. 11243]|nr:hypothetical protein ANO11243_036220 [fungal sp. No.11243]
MALNSFPEELLLQILDGLRGNHHSLLQAMLVNRRWYRIGREIFWRRPYAPAMQFVGSTQRQWCADKIETLMFLPYTDHQGHRHRVPGEYGEGDVNNMPTRTFAAYDGLPLPRLKAVVFYETQNDLQAIDVNADRAAYHRQISNFLGPQLEVFVSINSLPTWDGVCLFDLLETNSPRLRKLEIEDSENYQNSAGLNSRAALTRFMRLLDRLPRLQTVSLGGRYNHLATPEVITYLFSRRDLQSVSIPAKSLDDILMQEIVQTFPDGQFKHMVKLSLSGTLAAISPLVARTPSLTCLTLKSEYALPEIITAIKHLKDLKSLNVMLRRRPQMSVTDLKSVTSVFPQLGHLTITHGLSRPIHLLPCEDQELLDVFGNLREIRYCRFELHGEFESVLQRNLQAIVHKCPRLEHLSVNRNWLVDIDPYTLNRMPFEDVIDS